MERPSFVCHEIRPPKGGLLQGFFNRGFPAEHFAVAEETAFNRFAPREPCGFHGQQTEKAFTMY